MGCNPSISQDWDYPDMGEIAATRALQDACITYRDIEQVCVPVIAVPMRCARVARRSDYVRSSGQRFSRAP